ncbi:hypothetical protein D0B54_22970 [Solimonas sp. K1W22B-7]|uniref:hypothetical protein n=1 Tax=Solimonas sp. K1W22B-7 TaxID=2303331 RepID=UPI000E32FCB6|nr:hypothetical protein [Solimonas sp. K1W22B-7]AXQ31370.1 hypothetical protein D0B54_22970 [Solimonas sp. K1W22B-7]
MIDPQEIMDARNVGEVRCVLISEESQDLNRVLAQAGLRPDSSLLIEHDRTTAHSILAAIIQKDMPYQMPLMSKAEADGMADMILSAHDKPGSKYYSNGNWETREGWHPLGESSFDAGVIVTYGEGRYFCVWFEDKD